MKILDHIKHPFSEHIQGKKIKLSNSEKKIAIIGALAGLFFVGIGAPIAFYSITAFYKIKRIKRAENEQAINAMKSVRIQNDAFPNKKLVIEKISPYHSIDESEESITPSSTEEDDSYNSSSEEETLNFTTKKAEKLIAEDAIDSSTEEEESPLELNGIENENEETLTNMDNKALTAFAITNKNNSNLAYLIGNEIKSRIKNMTIEATLIWIEELPIFPYSQMLQQDIDNKLKAIPPSSLLEMAQKFPQRGNLFFKFFQHDKTKIDTGTLLQWSKILPAEDGSEAFNTVLRQYFDIHETPGDGNCCAYALARGQYPILLKVNDSSKNDAMLRDYANQVRNDIATYMETHTEEFSPFSDRIIHKTSPLEVELKRYQKGNHNISFENYLLNKIKDLESKGQTLLAEQLTTELSFKPANLDWGIYFARDAENGRDARSFEAYIYYLRQNGTYFGEQEILAFAKLAKKTVYTYNSTSAELNEDGTPKIDDRGLLKINEAYIKQPDNPMNAEPIYLSHTRGNHYELLTPKRR